jgi:hypothetical protein
MDCCGRVSETNYHCARCHQTFGTLDSFDGHQIRRFETDSPVTCLLVPEFARLRLVPDVNGVWRTPEGLARSERGREMMAGFARRRRDRAAQAA